MPPKAAAPPDSGEDAPQPDGPFWFYVKYGEQQEQIFNMNCWSVVLNDYIKATCGYGDIPELTDLQEEGGGLVELAAAGKAYAYTVLEPKGNYILNKMEVGEDGTTTTP